MSAIELHILYIKIHHGHRIAMKNSNLLIHNYVNIIMCMKVQLYSKTTICTFCLIIKEKKGDAAVPNHKVQIVSYSLF